MPIINNPFNGKLNLDALKRKNKPEDTKNEEKT